MNLKKIGVALTILVLMTVSAFAGDVSSGIYRSTDGEYSIMIVDRSDGTYAVTYYNSATEQSRHTRIREVVGKYVGNRILYNVDGTNFVLDWTTGRNFSDSYTKRSYRYYSSL
ncbi:hypothetical protein R84B8_00065 [Treponema sp. R8-4-B8]